MYSTVISDITGDKYYVIHIPRCFYNMRVVALMVFVFYLIFFINILILRGLI